MWPITHNCLGHIRQQSPTLFVPRTGLYPTIFSQTSIPKKEDLFIRVLRVHKRVVSPTVVGAGCRVFGAGLADDVLMDLVPFILIVTPGEQQKTIMSYKG